MSVMTDEYVGTLLRVDLTKGEIDRFEVPEPVLRMFLGGTGLGAKLLYDEVPPGTDWSDAQNRLILAAGPLNATDTSEPTSDAAV
jgi:aldehyde:ferredoxin oxidoreductase